MKRREFITLLGSMALPNLTLMRPASAESSSKRPLVIWLAALRGPPVGSRPFFAAFVTGMQDQGLVEGRDFDLVWRGADGALDRMPAIMEEVIQLKPDVILAPATLEAVAAKRATSTIPIVCAALADAVHLGLIASEARPGGNVTGIEPYIAGLPAKQIELAREIVPSARKIGLLTDQQDPKGPPQTRDLKTAGQALGLQIVSANANQPQDIEDALQRLASERVDVAIVLQTNLLLLNRSQIGASALEKRLPTVYGYREHVITGGLVSYGVDLRWCYRRAAYFVTKILRGAAPSDLPIEFPTSFWLAANLQTAKSLGIIVPPTLLARADEVIE
jgi:putative tryptophan/tyrosine transport system substrate-binding protein